MYLLIRYSATPTTINAITRFIKGILFCSSTAKSSNSLPDRETGEKPPAAVPIHVGYWRAALVDRRALGSRSSEAVNPDPATGLALFYGLKPRKRACFGGNDAGASQPRKPRRVAAGKQSFTAILCTYACPGLVGSAATREVKRRSQPEFGFYPDRAPDPSTIFLQMSRPMPVPGISSECKRVKRSNIRR